MAWGYGTLAAEVYDLDKPIGSSFGDVEFYRHLLDGVRGRLLEPAVGTGRMMIPLLQAGFTVEGFDSSPQMLAVCRQRCSDRDLEPVLLNAEMTSFASAEPYSAVIVPAGSITLLLGRETLTRALTCFRECLEPGGRLVVDVPAPQLVSGAEPMRTWAAGPSVWTMHTMRVDYDPSENQTTRWLRYEKWTDGALEATELQIFCLQHWSISEFTGLLRGAGFANTEISADYSPGSDPGPDSEICTYDSSRA